ncbi:hypothetical protein L2E82_47009 [Cichorium intybus]|uniref:Uncharacterized protein n=1 Tax=Cichorium intybus TaxID=13427 RepID=A0ACB8YUD4_CICIN|nr:hypothetical protein L2E82_47009 [Cichorium intybus]
MPTWVQIDIIRLEEINTTESIYPTGKRQFSSTKPEKTLHYLRKVNGSRSKSLNFCHNLSFSLEEGIRYNSRLPIAFGIPSSILRQIGVPATTSAADSCVVAPAMTFHPFPPLPLYPNRHVDAGQYNERFRKPNTMGRRYYKQHKWNYSRPGPTWNPNNKYGPGQFGPN